MNRTPNHGPGLLGVLILVLSSVLAPAAIALEEDGQLWSTLVVSSPKWENFRVDLLLQIRVRENMDQLERYLIDPSLTYFLNERFAVTLGYDAHLIRNPIKIDEQRIWQQAAGDTPIGDFDINHRFRLEERFIQHVHDVAVRLRYQLQIRSPELVSKIRLVLREEPFFNLNEPTSAFEAGFAENRASLGFQRPFTRHFIAELGYQAQYFRRPNEDRLNHVLMIGVGARF